MSKNFVKIKMCYVYSQWYDFSCVTPNVPIHRGRCKFRVRTIVRRQFFFILCTLNIETCLKGPRFSSINADSKTD